MTDRVDYFEQLQAKSRIRLLRHLRAVDRELTTPSPASKRAIKVLEAAYAELGQFTGWTKNLAKVRQGARRKSR